MEPLLSRKSMLLFAVLIFFQIGLKITLPFETKLWEDHGIAVNLVQEGEMYYNNDGARNHTFQFPVYSSFLALGYAIGGIHPEWGIALNIFVHAISVFLFIQLFGFLLQHFFNSLNDKFQKTIVYISAAAFFLHPAILMYTLFHVHPLSFNVFSLFAGLYFSFRFAFSPSKNNAILAGMVIGICMLDRATVLLTLIPSAIILLRTISLKEYIQKFVLVGGFIGLMITPWLIRNYLTDGIIGFESSAAKNVWKGVLYNSEGGNYLLNGETYYSVLSDEDKEALGKMSPIEQRNFFKAEYNEILKNDPGHVVKMFFIKLKNFWWFRSQAGEEWGSLSDYLIIYKIIYALILVLILYLFFISPVEMYLLLSFPLALSVLQAYFYVEMRHRVAIEPLLIFLALVSIHFIRRKYFSFKANANG